MILSELVRTSREAPHRTALLFNGVAFDYRTFTSLVLQARSFLRATGAFQRPAVVMVIGPSLLESWIATLALQSLGQTTLALPSWRDSETVGSLSDKIVSTALPGPAETLPTGKELFIIPAVTKALLSDSPEIPEDIALGSHLLQTSGTTGRPKRVLVTADRLDSILGTARSSGHDLTRLTAYFGDLGLWSAPGYWGPVTSWRLGGTVVVEQGDCLFQIMESRILSSALLTPDMLLRLLRKPGLSDIFDSNMILRVSGGALPWALAEEALVRLTPNIIVGLGSTEAGSIASSSVRAREDVEWLTLDATRTVQVVDNGGVLLSSGEVGLMRVALTDQSAGSYYEDSEASSKFFKNGYFYSGDLAQIDERGRIRVHGRVNDVVVLRGSIKTATLPLEQRIRDGLGVSGVCIFSRVIASGETSVHVALETDRRLGDLDLALVSRAVGQDVLVHALNRFPKNHMGKVLRAALQNQLAQSGAVEPSLRLPDWADAV